MAGVAGGRRRRSRTKTPVCFIKTTKTRHTYKPSAAQRAASARHAASARRAASVRRAVAARRAASVRLPSSAAAARRAVRLASASFWSSRIHRRTTSASRPGSWSVIQFTSDDVRGPSLSVFRRYSSSSEPHGFSLPSLSAPSPSPSPSCSSGCFLRYLHDAAPSSAPALPTYDVPTAHPAHPAPRQAPTKSPSVRLPLCRSSSRMDPPCAPAHPRFPLLLVGLALPCGTASRALLSLLLSESSLLGDDDTRQRALTWFNLGPSRRSLSLC